METDVGTVKHHSEYYTFYQEVTRVFTANYCSMRLNVQWTRDKSQKQPLRLMDRQHKSHNKSRNIKRENTNTGSGTCLFRSFCQTSTIHLKMLSVFFMDYSQLS